MQLSYLIILIVTYTDYYYTSLLYECKNDPMQVHMNQRTAQVHQIKRPPRSNLKVIFDANLHLNLRYDVSSCIIGKYNIIEQMKKIFSFY